MIPSLTAHLLQSTLFAAAAGLLTLAFRRNRAQIRYWLWLSASLKFVIPFALLMSLGSYLESRMPAAHKIAVPLASYTIEQFSGPFFPDNLPAPAPASGTIHWMPIAILAGWLCGFAAVALIRFRNWSRVRAAVRASTATNICAAVGVRVSPGLLEPGVVGLVRPILLLPEGIADRLTPSELKAVLAHELCHIRRRDNLFAAIHMMVEVTFWFHPLVWWIGARLVDERERACDEEVLRQGNEPDTYADAILNVCKLYMESPLACVSGVSGAGISRRIETIMSNRKLQGLNRAKKLLLATAGIAAVAGPMALGLLIGVESIPEMHAQPPVADPPAPIQPALARNPPPPAAPAPRTATLKFEVASIKPSPNCMMPHPAPFSTGRLTVSCITSQNLIRQAYGSFGDARNPWIQISGGPAWLATDTYDVEARAGDRNASPEQMYGPMMRALLVERFRLVIHRETRELPVYALTVAKNGPKIRPTKEGSCAVFDLSHLPIPPDPNQPKPCGGVSMSGSAAGQTLDIAGITMAKFAANRIGGRLDMPVIDRTGLTGIFDIHLEFAVDTASTVCRGSCPDPVASSGPSIFTAIQDQLGLKLSSDKGPVEILVIDNVDRPSEN